MYNCDETSETKKSSEDGKSSEKSDENSETSKSSETQEKDEDGNSGEKSNETSASEEKKILKSEIEQLKKQLEELTSDETSEPKKVMMIEAAVRMLTKVMNSTRAKIILKKMDPMVQEKE